MKKIFAPLLLLALSTAPGWASTAKKPSRDPRTVGLGRSCKQSKDCNGHGQRCIKESDANGKPKEQGFCVLPCASFEAGTTKVNPAAPPPDMTKKPKKPPPRCPPKYQCRSAGAGVPIDMCVKE